MENRNITWPDVSSWLDVTTYKWLNPGSHLLQIDQGVCLKIAEENMGEVWFKRTVSWFVNALVVLSSTVKEEGSF